MKIFLIGFMGAGKSLIGNALSKTLQYDFLDTDHWIEKENNTSINHIFKTKGENYFRQLERDLISTLKLKKNGIIATGGGTPCHLNNLALMKEMGQIVYLKTDESILIERLNKEKSKRPLIKDLPSEDLAKYVKDQLIIREPFYSQAHCIIETYRLSPKKICQEIIAHCY